MKRVMGEKAGTQIKITGRLYLDKVQSFLLVFNNEPTKNLDDFT